MSATTDEAGKRTSLTSAADFHTEIALRSRARTIFAPKVHPAPVRGRLSPEKCIPLMSAVKMHE